MLSEHKPISSATISSKTDAALDKQLPSNGKIMPAVPKMEDDDDDVAMSEIAPAANGTKRKANNHAPSFAEPESSDDDRPLVRITPSLYTYGTLD